MALEGERLLAVSERPWRSWDDGGRFRGYAIPSVVLRDAGLDVVSDADVVGAIGTFDDVRVPGHGQQTLRRRFLRHLLLRVIPPRVS